MRVRNRVREVRQARGLSVAELARLSGISAPTIFTIERDQGYVPHGGIFLKIHRALNETMLFWVEREASDPPPPDEGVQDAAIG